MRTGSWAPKAKRYRWVRREERVEPSGSLKAMTREEEELAR